MRVCPHVRPYVRTCSAGSSEASKRRKRYLSVSDRKKESMRSSSPFPGSDTCPTEANPQATRVRFCMGGCVYESGS